MSFSIESQLATFVWCTALALVVGHADAGENPQTSEKESSRSRLLSFEELERGLSDSKWRILDPRPRDEYDRGHIPGAVWIDIKALEAHAKQPGGLEDRKFWEAWVGTLGVAPETEIYVYDARRQLDAARVWFFLRLIGFERVGLIDGGYPLWAEQKRPVSIEVPQIGPRPVSIKFNKQIVAHKADVQALLKDKSASVLDARSDEEFVGTKKMSRRGGHIPSACHLEWTQLVDDSGRFFDADLLRTKVEKSGIKPGAEVVTHCQGGGRASVNAFVLERLGFKARNYYLGWSDWGNTDETPIEVAPEKNVK